MGLSILDSVVAAAAAPSAGQSAGGFSFLIIIVIMFVAMYFMLIRPQQKRQKQHRAMVEALGKGDEVITNGGIAGRIDQLGDSFITVEIAEGVKIKVQRSAVAHQLAPGTLKSA